MKDEFTNRLNAFRTTLDFLQAPANKSKWDGQPPVRFTTRVAEAVTAVAALAEFCQQQGAVIKGAAVDKAREEKELENAAFVLGQAVAECCRGLGNAADAARCAFSKSAWRGMRDAALLANAREVIRIAEGLLAGTQAAVAGECGITAASVAACKKEADDYEAAISAPRRPSRAGRPPPARCGIASTRSRLSSPASTAWSSSSPTKPSLAATTLPARSGTTVTVPVRNQLRPRLPRRRHN